jgi:2-polyprenyl-6-methoxyphenol hydroxylase-like FAD-dependent oxidoreductase
MTLNFSRFLGFFLALALASCGSGNPLPATPKADSAPTSLPSAPNRVGLKVHVRGINLSRDLEVHLGAGGYVGLARLPGGAANVCALLRRRSLGGRGSALLCEHLRACGLERLAARMAAAEADEASFSAVAALAFDRRVVRSDRVRIGDACALVPPFTGNGMAMAFQGAELALDPLLEFARGRAGWTETRRAIHGALHGRFRTRLAAAAVLHPFLLGDLRRRVLAAAGRTRLVPFGPLYAALH